MTKPVKPRRYGALYWLLAISLAPVVAAVYAFYGVDWRSKANTDTTNYGELLNNPMAMPAIQGMLLDGKPFVAASLYKKWVYATVDSGACNEPCATRLFTTRQLRAMAGKERDRVMRVWWVLDDAPINPQLLTAHPDLLVVRVKPADMAFLQPQTGQRVSDHIWMIDPLGRPMMRYLVAYEPSRMKSDLTKLLYASQSWQH